MTESTSFQENHENEVGSNERVGYFINDHYCVGHDMVSLLLEEQVCVGMAEAYDAVATDSYGWVGCGNGGM